MAGWTAPEPLAAARLATVPEGAAPAVAAAPTAAPAPLPWTVLLRRVLDLAAPTTLLALI